MLSQNEEVDVKSRPTFLPFESGPPPMATVGMAGGIPARGLPPLPETALSLLIEKH